MVLKTSIELLTRYNSIIGVVRRMLKNVTILRQASRITTD